MEADSPLKQPIINIKCLRLWKMRVDGDKHTRTSAAELTHTSGPRRRPRTCRQTETASINQIITFNKAPRRDEFRGIFEKCFQRFLTEKQSLKDELISNFKIMLIFCGWSHVEKRQSQKKKVQAAKSRMHEEEKCKVQQKLASRLSSLSVQEAWMCYMCLAQLASVKLKNWRGRSPNDSFMGLVMEHQSQPDPSTHTLNPPFAKSSVPL